MKAWHNDVDGENLKGICHAILDGETCHANGFHMERVWLQGSREVGKLIFSLSLFVLNRK